MKLNKSSIALFLSLLIGIIFFLLYQKYQELNRQTTDAIQAIPINAAVIIETDDWNSSLKELENTTIWSAISNSEDWKSIKENIDSLTKKIETSEELKYFISNQKLYLSVHHSTNDFYFLISTACSAEDLRLIQTNNSILGNYKSREYDGVQIFELDNNWNICHHKDILFLSSSPLLIEDGIRQLNYQRSLLNN